MKNIITIAILCFLISTDLVAQDRASQIYNKITDPNNKEITVVAHRADWRYAPENSIAAIKRSIKQGVDVVEVDIQKTKDGKIILMHDKTIDRTTTGKGKISEWTLDSIRT